MSSQTTPENTASAWLDQVKWNDDGLVPAIAQDADNGRILMMAWMNRESLALSAQENRAVYWSRSRGKLWRRRAMSRSLKELDCDADAIVLKVKQLGGIACHTGRESCFYRTLKGDEWQTVEPVLKDPKEIY